MEIAWFARPASELARLPREERMRIWRGAVNKALRRWQTWLSLAAAFAWAGLYYFLVLGMGNDPFRRVEQPSVIGALGVINFLIVAGMALPHAEMEAASRETRGAPGGGAAPPLAATSRGIAFAIAAFYCLHALFVPFDVYDLLGTASRSVLLLLGAAAALELGAGVSLFRLRKSASGWLIACIGIKVLGLVVSGIVPVAIGGIKLHFFPVLNTLVDAGVLLFLRSLRRRRILE